MNDNVFDVDRNGSAKINTKFASTEISVSNDRPYCIFDNSLHVERSYEKRNDNN